MPTTIAGGTSPEARRAPAMPTCTIARGGSAAMAAAVAAAASTGPTPQTSVRQPSDGASSRSVAATTRMS